MWLSKSNTNGWLKTTHGWGSSKETIIKQTVWLVQAGTLDKVIKRNGDINGSSLRGVLTLL